MQDLPELSVLVPVRNEGAVIASTARAILDQRFAGTVEFLIVDGLSDDGTRATLDGLAAEDARVRVLENPRGDLASALNIGLEAAKGEFVAKMDAHTYFPPDYLQTGVDRLRRGDVSWVSGPPVPHGVGAWSRRIALALGTVLGVGGSGKWLAGTPAGSPEEERELRTGVFSGIWRRSVLERVGGWSPGWPVNEDSELASRFLASGERIVCVRAMAARYVPRESLAALGRQYWRYGFYRAKTANRHPDSVGLSQLAPPALLVSQLGWLAGRPGRAVARLSLAAYGAAQLGVTARVASREGLRDAVFLPAVFATMHGSFGAGWLAGCARFGLPVAGIGRALGARRRASDMPSTNGGNRAHARRLAAPSAEGSPDAWNVSR
jgi:GT2 family glycosyltransferase